MTSKHPHYDAIVAWAEGKTIQTWSDEDRTWYDWALSDAAPCFYRDNEYRVKPEPRHDWAVESKAPHTEGYWFVVFQSTEGELNRKFPNTHYRQLVDVLDEE